MDKSLLALLAGLAAAGCDADRVAEPADAAGNETLANRIEAVSVAKEEEPAPPLRLGVLAEGDIPAEYRAGPACRLEQGDRLLLLAAAPGAVARVDGRVALLRTGGPVGPSGGFFEAEGVTVSIGRRTPPEGSAEPPASHAGATVGGAAGRPIEKVSGRWTCSR